MSRAALGVRHATAADVDVLSAVLARAFHDDPVMTWMMTDDRRRERLGHLAFGAFLRRMYLPKGAVYTDEARRGAALWAPPGAWKTPLATQLEMAPSLFRVVKLRNVPRMVRGLECIERAHPDHEPHWYLGVLGTDPVAQGQGVASAVLAPVLDRCDAEGVPAYLESSKHANIAFYRRHGFEVTDTISLPDGPDVWGMWREPREGPQWREPREGPQWREPREGPQWREPREEGEPHG